MARLSLESTLTERFAAPEFADVPAAYLYGSAAEGRMHAESDVDLAVLLDRRLHPSERERFERRLSLMAALASAVGSRDLDLVVLNDLPPLFARRIVIHGKRIHCADPERVRGFERDVQLLAADLEPFLRRMQQIKLDGVRGS